MNTFGKRLKQARLAKGLYQKDLGEKLGGVKSNSISNWESDQNRPDVDIIAKMCEVLEVTPNYLIGNYDNGDEAFILSAQEKKIIIKYRETPKMQSAVHRILGIED